MTDAEWKKWYEDAKKDSGLYAKRFVKLYEHSMVCPHGKPTDERGACVDCFKVMT